MDVIDPIEIDSGDKLTVVKLPSVNVMSDELAR